METRLTVVLVKSDLIDKLGVAVPLSIPFRPPIVGSLGRRFRFLPEPRGASARDPRAPPSTRRSAARLMEQPSPSVVRRIAPRYNRLLAMYTRRDFTRITLASLPVSAAFAARKPNSRVAGVQLGAQSYSFRTMPFDDAIKAMTEIGLNECELWQGHVEPQQQARGEEAREQLRKWRLVPPWTISAISARSGRAAGINLYAYNYSFRDDFTDGEIDRGFGIGPSAGSESDHGVIYGVYVEARGSLCRG